MFNPKSTSAGQEVRVPVTVVEVPHMRVLGVRGYRMTPYGMQAAGEAWLSADQLSDSFPHLGRRLPKRDGHNSRKKLSNDDLVEVRLIVATQPHVISEHHQKTPDVMEVGLSGGSISAQLDWAKKTLVRRFPLTMCTKKEPWLMQ